jgi:GT2 family glycosyltransferase
MPTLVSVVITTYNSAATLELCLEWVFQQQHSPQELIVIDNLSTDGTREILKRFEQKAKIVLNDTNVGFAAAQNQGIRIARGEWLLSLNPDVLLQKDFVSRLLAAVEGKPDVGTVCGKLLRWLPGQNPERSNVIDSTGICFVRNLRHFDRGAEETDQGQYQNEEYVFGATGAAALYRRAMIEDISIDGEFFDEDFFAYREDADLSWRAQIMGWTCWYTPKAVAWHVRRVTPERFGELPLVINWHSVKNRFLMRMKNITAKLYLRLLLPVTLRDLLIIGYCLLRDRRLLSALYYPWKNRRAILRKRRWIQAHRRVSDEQLAAWFTHES